MVFGGITVFAAVQAWRTGNSRYGWGALVSVSLQLTMFLAGPAGSAGIDRLRLVQVAAIVGYIGMLVAMLALRWNPSSPVRAILIGSVVALGIAGLDRALGLGQEPRRVLSRSTWPDSSDAHAVLGRVPRPHSTFKVYYDDDRDGYLREADLRTRNWQLILRSGSQAELILPPESPQLLRVAIRKATPDTIWHIQLVQSRFDLERQVPYYITFRARADRPRPIAVGVMQNHPPWATMGLIVELPLSQQWKNFREVFTAPRSDTNSIIVFNLAANSASVEIDSLELHGPPSGRRIDPVVTGIRPFVSYQRNSMGCRDRDPGTPKPAGTVRILALGDGFTEGAGLHARDTFSRLLEAELNGSSDGGTGGQRFEVINCGVSGYGSREQRLFYELIASGSSPDLVLVTMTWDDDRFHWEARRGNLLRLPPSRLERLSAVAHRIGDNLRMSRTHDYGPSVEDLLGFDKEVRAHGARLIVAVSRHGPSGLGDSLLATARRGLAGTDIPLLDLGLLGATDSIPGIPSGLPGHASHHAVALELAGWIRKEVLPTRP